MEKIVEKKINLNDGNKINIIGLATHNFKSEELLGDIILSGFALGYKRIEISPEYKNANVLKNVLFRSFLARNEIFLSCIYDPINSKNPDDHRVIIRDYTYSIGTEYLDMVILKCDNEYWKYALEVIIPCISKGRINSVGVRFATIKDIEYIKDKFNIYPSLLQKDIHPGKLKDKTLEFCKDKNIAISSTNLMLGGDIIKIDKVQEIGKKYDLSVFQVAIKWAEQRNIIINTRTQIITQIKENISVNGISFTEEELVQLDNVKYDIN